MVRHSNRDERAVVAALVTLACELNQACGRRTYEHGDRHEYSGYRVKTEGLESAVAAAFQSFGGVPLYASPYNRAAVLLLNVATGHHFLDGNKRTALHLALAFLDLHRLTVVPPSAEEGAKLVESAVTRKDLSYEERRTFVETTLKAWTVRK